MKRFSAITITVLGVLTSLGAGGYSGVRADEAIVVIVNPGVGVDSLALDELKFMYLGKRSRWDAGVRVQPAVLKSSDLHKTFVTEMLGRTPAKYNSYWKQLVFTGKGVPPRSFDSEDELIAYVRATDGGIGYVSAGATLDGVSAIELF